MTKARLRREVHQRSAKMLRDYMEGMGVSGTQLSQGVGISPARLMKLLDGEASWQLDELAQTVWYLGYSLDDFLSLAGLRVRVSEKAEAFWAQSDARHHSPNAQDQVSVP